MASAQLPQPTRSQAGKPDEFEFKPKLTGWSYQRKLLFRPGTLSVAGSYHPILFSPAFDPAFDHLQLIRATLIFKMQKAL